MEMAEIDIAEENLRNPKAVQNVILIEDGKETSLNVALARILAFHRIRVPYC